MDENEIRELLARIEALEKNNSALENKFESLESQVQTINRFISAITEAQDLEQTMNEIESVTKQLTDCDKAAFFCYDNSNDKFFSHGDYRNWHEEQATEEIKNAFDSKEILSDNKAAVIPLVSANGNSLGVIVAEKESGFTPKDYDNFRQGCQVVNTVELALKKEFEHQGRITDELTHLKNRQGLNEYLANTLCGNINDGRDVNILMCDIDHFKNVNDTYGHDAGDIILKGVAEVLQEGTRAGADCAFRMGGEEMVCILNCSPEKAMEIAERLREQVENTVHSITKNNEPVEVKVTVSMGLHNMKPNMEMTPENARAIFDTEFKNADEAVYKAKETGRNKVVAADENVYISYLALKAAELLCSDDRTNVDDVKQQTVEMLIADKDFEMVIEALQAHAEEHPELSAAADNIISKLEEVSHSDTEKSQVIETEENTMSNYENKAPKYYTKDSFKEIRNKEYINTDASTAFKIAQRAMAENVEFSAKYDGARSAVTVDGVKDRAFVESVRAEFNIPANSRSERQTEKSAQNYRHEYAPQENKPAYFGRKAATQESSNSYFARNDKPQSREATYFNREGFKNIQNKEYIRTDSKTAYSISMEAQKFGIEHSVKYDGEKSAVTLDGVKDKAFVAAVRKEFNIPENSRPERQTEKPAYFGHKSAQQGSRNSYPAHNDKTQNKEASYFNREGFKDIRNKTFIQTDSRTAYSISKEAARQGVEHSAKYDGEKSAVTVDGVKDRDFIEAVRGMADWAEKVQIKEAQTQNIARNSGAR